MIKSTNWMLLAWHLRHTEDPCLLLWWLTLRDHKCFIANHGLHLIDCAIMQGISLSWRPIVLTLINNHEARIVRVIFIEFWTILVWWKRAVLAVESIRAAIIFILPGWSIQYVGCDVMQHLMSNCFCLIIFLGWHWGIKLWIGLV